MSTSPTFQPSSRNIMLSVAPSEPQNPLHTRPHPPTPYLPAPSARLRHSFSSASTSTGHIMPHRVSVSSASSAEATKERLASVNQALEVARDSPEGASDPSIFKILDEAVSDIWVKIQTKPDSYVMTRDEFAVFNYFQARFHDNKIAMDAKKRFWDNLRA